MQITPKDREMFDTMAQRIVATAQETIRNTPGINPTDAYRLAIAAALEQHTTTLLTLTQLKLRMRIEAMILAAEQSKENDRT